MRVFIYNWDDGRQSVIAASSRREGLEALGNDPFTTTALDSYTVDQARYYFEPGSSGEKSWRNFEAMDGQFTLQAGMSGEYIHRTFLDLFRRHSWVECILPNKDKVVLGRDLGEYVGVVKVIAITLYYGEYVESGWDEYDPNDHHYFGCRGLKFHLDQTHDAIEAATHYVLGRKGNDRLFTKARSLEQIAERLASGFSFKYPTEMNSEYQE